MALSTVLDDSWQFSCMLDDRLQYASLALFKQILCRLCRTYYVLFERFFTGQHWIVEDASFSKRFRFKPGHFLNIDTEQIESTMMISSSYDIMLLFFSQSNVGFMMETPYNRDFYCVQDQTLCFVSLKVHNSFCVNYSDRFIWATCDADLCTIWFLTRYYFNMLNNLRSILVALKIESCAPQTVKIIRIVTTSVFCKWDCNWIRCSFNLALLFYYAAKMSAPIETNGFSIGNGISEHLIINVHHTVVINCNAIY